MVHVCDLIRMLAQRARSSRGLRELQGSQASATLATVMAATVDLINRKVGQTATPTRAAKATAEGRHVLFTNTSVEETQSLYTDALFIMAAVPHVEIDFASRRTTEKLLLLFFTFFNAVIDNQPRDPVVQVLKCITKNAPSLPTTSLISLLWLLSREKIAHESCADRDTSDVLSDATPHNKRRYVWSEAPSTTEEDILIVLHEVVIRMLRRHGDSGRGTAMRKRVGEGESGRFNCRTATDNNTTNKTTTMTPQSPPSAMSHLLQPPTFRYMCSVSTHTTISDAEILKLVSVLPGVANTMMRFQKKEGTEHRQAAVFTELGRALEARLAPMNLPVAFSEVVVHRQLSIDDTRIVSFLGFGPYAETHKIGRDCMAVLKKYSWNVLERESKSVLWHCVNCLFFIQRIYCLEYMQEWLLPVVFDAVEANAEGQHEQRQCLALMVGQLWEPAMRQLLFAIVFSLRATSVHSLSEITTQRLEVLIGAIEDALSAREDKLANLEANLLSCKVALCTQRLRACRDEKDGIGGNSIPRETIEMCEEIAGTLAGFLCVGDNHNECVSRPYDVSDALKTASLPAATLNTLRHLDGILLDSVLVLQHCELFEARTRNKDVSNASTIRGSSTQAIKKAEEDEEEESVKEVPTLACKTYLALLILLEHALIGRFTLKPRLVSSVTHLLFLDWQRRLQYIESEEWRTRFQTQLCAVALALLSSSELIPSHAAQPQHTHTDEMRLHEPGKDSAAQISAAFAKDAFGLLLGIGLPTDALGTTMTSLSQNLTQCILRISQERSSGSTTPTSLVLVWQLGNRACQLGLGRDEALLRAVLSVVRDLSSNPEELRCAPWPIRTTLVHMARNFYHNMIPQFAVSRTSRRVAAQCLRIVSLLSLERMDPLPSALENGTSGLTVELLERLVLAVKVWNFVSLAVSHRVPQLQDKRAERYYATMYISVCRHTRAAVAAAELSSFIPGQGAHDALSARLAAIFSAQTYFDVATLRHEETPLILNFFIARVVSITGVAFHAMMERTNQWSEGRDRGRYICHYSKAFCDIAEVSQHAFVPCVWHEVSNVTRRFPRLIALPASQPYAAKFTLLHRRSMEHTLRAVQSHGNRDSWTFSHLSQQQRKGNAGNADAKVLLYPREVASFMRNQDYMLDLRARVYLTNLAADMIEEASAKRGFQDDQELVLTGKYFSAIFSFFRRNQARFM